MPKAARTCRAHRGDCGVRKGMRRPRIRLLVASALLPVGGCTGIIAAGPKAHLVTALAAPEAPVVVGRALAAATDSVWVFTNRAFADGRWQAHRGDVQRLVRAFRVTPARSAVRPLVASMNVRAAGEQWLDTVTMHRALRTSLEANPDGALVLHVHGYATSLDEATEEAAEMRRRGGFAGQMAVFAWPSRSLGVTWPARGRLFTNAYWQDSVSAEASVDDFVRVLHEVVVLVGADRVVLSAHSMGNQLLAKALQRAEVQALLEPVPLRAMVFALPDVARDWFHTTVVPAAQPLADRLVLYGARNDHMLRIASVVHDEPRAGLLADGALPETRGLEVVDITEGCKAAPRLGALFDTNHALRRHDAALTDLFGHVAVASPAVQPREAVSSCAGATPRR